MTFFQSLGPALALYTAWSAFEGKVYAKDRAWGRTIVREEEPRYFWTIIAIYAGLSLALFFVF